jgi:hypothetical protein
MIATQKAQTDVSRGFIRQFGTKEALIVQSEHSLSARPKVRIDDRPLEVKFLFGEIPGKSTVQQFPHLMSKFVSPRLILFFEIDNFFGAELAESTRYVMHM